MIIVSSSLYAFRFKVVAADPAPAPVKSAFIAAPFSSTWPAADTQTLAFPLCDPAQKNSSKTATVSTRPPASLEPSQFGRARAGTQPKDR
jgi:hypothetical protein